MNELVGLGNALKAWSAGAFVALIILAMLTDTLVWGGRLRRTEKERDRWQTMALELLGVTDRMTGAAETVNEILDKRLPETDAATTVANGTVPAPPNAASGAPRHELPGRSGFREAARLAGEAALRRFRE